MNFKLNEIVVCERQHSNCFKTKVQLNKCEIHMDVTFTFNLPEGATVIFGLVFLGNWTIWRQTNLQSSHFTDWSTCGLVKSPKCVM